jgi:DNA transformation protein
MRQLDLLQDERQAVHDTIEPTLSVRNMAQRLPDPDLFDGLSEHGADQWASYLYSKPRPQTKKLSSRSHIISLYDPFASRKDFPDGRRWCANVYTGCAFACRYCYTVAYIKNAFHPRVKEGFERLLLRDLDELIDLGSVEAYLRIWDRKDIIGYNMLYALEGAIQGVRWHDLPEEHRRRVKEELLAALASRART